MTIGKTNELGGGAVPRSAGYSNGGVGDPESWERPSKIGMWIGRVGLTAYLGITAAALNGGVGVIKDDIRDAKLGSTGSAISGAKQGLADELGFWKRERARVVNIGNQHFVASKGPEPVLGMTERVDFGLPRNEINHVYAKPEYAQIIREFLAKNPGSLRVRIAGQYPESVHVDSELSRLGLLSALGE
ncbi:MAG: hypothetical protein ACKVPX_04325 [Myxococcaceae bacterium]